MTSQWTWKNIVSHSLTASFFTSPEESFLKTTSLSSGQLDTRFGNMERVQITLTVVHADVHHGEGEKNTYKDYLHERRILVLGSILIFIQPKILIEHLSFASETRFKLNLWAPKLLSFEVRNKISIIKVKSPAQGYERYLCIKKRIEVLCSPRVTTRNTEEENCHVTEYSDP